MKHSPLRAISITGLAALLAWASLPGRGPSAPGLSSLLLAQQSQSTPPQGGTLVVRPEVMAASCLTMVSPKNLPRDGIEQEEAAVVLRVIVSKTGRVFPLAMVSGPTYLEDEARNAARLWRYKPYTYDDVVQEVATEIRVDFIPGRPAGLITHPNH